MAGNAEALTASGLNSNPMVLKTALNWSSPHQDWGLSSKS
jgi:hypothetical protein